MTSPPSSTNVEEAADLMKAVVEAMFSLAAFERSTDQYISEREREEYFRLKKFKKSEGVMRENFRS